jgi:hypothetical protein
MVGMSVSARLILSAGVRRAVAALALVALFAGCGGATGETSTKGSPKGDSVDTVMDQRLAVPEPKLPPPLHRPERKHGAMFARYFIGGSLEYVVRSGFTVDSRRAQTRTCKRCHSVWAAIDHEYEQGHHVEMTPTVIDVIRVRRGPIIEDHGGFKTTFWVVDLRYHVDELSIRDADGVISTAKDLVFVDRLVASYDHFDEEWRVQFWKSIPSQPDVPILGDPSAVS